MKPTKEMMRQLRADNRKFGIKFEEIPREFWNAISGDHTANWRSRVIRNRHFLVQIFTEPDGYIRLSVNRTDMNREGNWKDGITWDELQDIKFHAGYADNVAIEVFPREDCVVKVANMRHLWILNDISQIPVWGWNRKA